MEHLFVSLDILLLKQVLIIKENAPDTTVKKSVRKILR